MWKKYTFYLLIVMLISCNTQKSEVQTFTGAPGEVKLITLDPGHFHAALVQKNAYPQVSDEVYVYSPGGSELTEHLKKINTYNNRPQNPTKWKEIVYTGDDFLQKMLIEKKGNVMVIAGNNKSKTDYIKQTLNAGINVLADKPMAINSDNFETLKECFEIAEKNKVLLYDIMTERYEISTILQKELSLMPEVYGKQLKGTPEDPAIVKESVHHFFKTVSGSPLLRPAWFFDVNQEGEGIVDVTTHLVDLVQWEAFPNQIIDYKKDINMIDANHWTTPISTDQFKQVTGETNYPEYLKKNIKNDTLYVYCNGDIIYKIKDIYAKVSVIWNYTYPEGGGDNHYSVMKGSKANLIIHQGKEEKYTPELYIELIGDENPVQYEQGLNNAIKTIKAQYPDVALEKVTERRWKIEIPSSYRVGHEAHFGQVTEHYLQYLKEGVLPDWEVPNMLAKYYVTISALNIAKQKG